jgi:hypothetical protein
LAISLIYILFFHGSDHTKRHPKDGNKQAPTVLTVMVNVVLFLIVPKGFFPQQDTGRIMGYTTSSARYFFFPLTKKLHATRIWEWRWV